MKGLRLIELTVCSCIFLGILGCSSDKPAPLMVLDPPPNTVTQVQTYLTEGNRLFREGRWEGARQQFQAAVQEQPDLAEAHYNLALAMDHMGDRDAAKPHFIKAANLAPGHKVIWDSPPLRRYGNVPDKPVEATSSPVLPGIGSGGSTSPGGGF
ncbi:MAG: tetratricopeptide repeat protein [Nitrospirota bacterium]|nr:tetratricopeptide repeat protein [Nitrospirota bacterium]